MLRTVLSSVLVAVLLLAPPALAGVDLPVTASSSVKGTIAPEGETEVFSFDATAGTLLSLSLAAKKSPDLLLMPELRDPFGDPVPLGVAAPTAKIKAKKILLGLSGTYRLTIGGTGTGEYQLKLKGKPAKKFDDDALFVSAGGSEPFMFSAPPGSTVTLKAKAAKGSSAAPQFGTLSGQDLGGEGKLTSKSHTVKVADLGAGSDWSVEVRNLAATDGDIVVTVSVKAPKTAKTKRDLRGIVFGLPGGGETVIGRPIDAAGGTVEVDDEGSEIDGAMAEVPSDAVSEPTVFVVSSSVPSEVPDPDATQTAGPTVEFGPAGTTFLKPVRVTVPYDPGRIPPGEAPGDVLRVMRESGGAPQFLDPVEVDTFAETVTVETLGFSKFTPTSPKGPPNLEGRTYWSLFVEAEMDDYRDPGKDSRKRLFWMGIGTVTFGKVDTADDSSFAGTEYMFEYTHTDNTAAYSADPDLLVMQVDGAVTSDSESFSGTGEWSYETGKQAVTFAYDQDDDVTYTMSPDGSVLIGGYDEGCACMLQEVLLEKPAKALTAKQLEGDYWLGMAEHMVWKRGNAPLGMTLSRAFASLTLKSGGTASISWDEDSSFYIDVPQTDVKGTWTTDKDSGSASADWEVAGSSAGALEGSVLLTFGDGDDSFRFFPGPNGTVLVGTDAVQEGNGFTFFVLVKKGSGMKSSTLSGDYRAISWEMEPSDYAVEFVKYQPIRDQFGQLIGFTDEVIEMHWMWVGDLRMNEIDETWSFGTKLTLKGITEKEVFRTGNPMPGGVDVDETTDEGPYSETFRLTSDGKLTVTGTELEDLVGAVTKDGTFGFGVENPKNSESLFGLTLFVKPPPAK